MEPSPEVKASREKIFAEYAARMDTPPKLAPPPPAALPAPKRSLDDELAEVAAERERMAADRERHRIAHRVKWDAAEAEKQRRITEYAAISAERQRMQDIRDEADRKAQHEAGMQPVRDLARFLCDRIEHRELGRIIAAIGRTDREHLVAEMREIHRIDNDDIRHHRRDPVKVSSFAARQFELNAGAL